MLTWLWLGWADLFFGLFSALLLPFGAVLAACVLSFGAAGVCLVGNLRTLPYIMLPEMPYWCGAILGPSLLALCVLSVVGCIWFFAFVWQIWRAYGRFHHNALAPAMALRCSRSFRSRRSSRRRKSGSCAPRR